MTKLSAQQQAAVNSVEGPLLLLAVPGGGKTTVLVLRLGHMILDLGIAPEQILTLTYTVAATKDMGDRFASFFGQELRERLEFRTINGICSKIIQYYGRILGKTSFELATDEGLITRILTGIYREIEREYPTESDIQNLRTRIAYIKNMMLSEAEIDELEKEADCHLAQIYRAYCGALKQEHLMDYDDQMTYALRILQVSPETRDFFCSRYSYICVDEAQDTSRIQHEIIRLLARSGNLFMVGDEDQSIYGFRAAYPDALLSFEQDHPGAQVLLMEDNFRSNARIVEAADRFIQENIDRHEKHMRAVRPLGAPIRGIEAKSRRAQIGYLVKVAEQCAVQAGNSAGQAGSPLRKTAILYRDNESAIPLIDRLERKGIPYRIRKADLTFFSHRVVRDIQNIVAFAEDPCNTELFMQIYYKLNLYLNKQNAEVAAAVARQQGIRVLDAAVRYLDVPFYTKNNLKAMGTHLQNLLQERADAALYRIENFMGYRDYLDRSGIGTGKLYTLKALAGEERTPRSYLNRLSTLHDLIQNKENDPSCPLILSTIHASKGLEYDCVYLMDQMDGVFPEDIPDRNCRDEKRIKAYEEERRLFYVGVTRAKEELSLFLLPEGSSFCRELLKPVREDGFRRTARGIGNAAGGRSGAGQQKWNRTFNRDDRETFLNQLGEGVIVEHQRFGRGAVVSMSDISVIVEFPDKTRSFLIDVVYEKGVLRIL